MNRKSFYLILLIIAIYFFSCSKAGTGGAVDLVVTPVHHSKTAPGAMIYIKYGTTDFPGENVSVYDDSGIADSTIAGVAPNFAFKNLRKGKYFLWAVGYDSSLSTIVKGGVPVVIDIKSGTFPVTVPMTN